MKAGLLILLTITLVSSCKKDQTKNSSVYTQLTKTWWTLYLSPPGTIGTINSGYGLYHVPANIGAYSISGHSILFENSNIKYSPERPLELYSWELQNNLTEIKVNKSAPGINNNEIWVIREISDTLLDLQIRDASESASTQNFWGLKYRRR